MDPQKKSPSVEEIAGRRSGMLLGGVAGAYAGSLHGMETGATMATAVKSTIKGQNMGKQHVADDMMRSMKKADARSGAINIEGRAEPKLIRDASSSKDKIKQGLAQGKDAIKRGLKGAGRAASDAASDAATWAKRPSMSRSLVGGVAIGAALGRHFGAKGGRSMHEANKERSRVNAQKSAETKARRQAMEIARARVIAQEIMKNQQLSIGPGMIQVMLEEKKTKDTRPTRAAFAGAAGAIGGTVSGGYLGTIKAITHPQTGDMMAEGLERAFRSGTNMANNATDDSWKNQEIPKAFGEGKFSASERAARASEIRSHQVRGRFSRNIKRGMIAGAILGGGANYAAGRAGLYGGGPKHD
jgi:hypothetical protein